MKSVFLKMMGLLLVILEGGGRRMRCFQGLSFKVVCQTSFVVAGGLGVGMGMGELK